MEIPITIDENIEEDQPRTIPTEELSPDLINRIRIISTPSQSGFFEDVNRNLLYNQLFNPSNWIQENNENNETESDIQAEAPSISIVENIINNSTNPMFSVSPVTENTFNTNLFNNMEVGFTLNNDLAVEDLLDKKIEINISNHDSISSQEKLNNNIKLKDLEIIVENIETDDGLKFELGFRLKESNSNIKIKNKEKLKII